MNEPQVIVQSLASSNELYRQVFSTLASRKKSPTTDIYRFRNYLNEDHKTAYSNDEVMEVFRTFEKRGLGTIVLKQDNVRPVPSMKWKKLNSKQVGLMAKGTSSVASPAVLDVPASSGSGGDKIITVYPLRPDFPVRITLPANITRDELNRLSLFISNLI